MALPANVTMQMAATASAFLWHSMCLQDTCLANQCYLATLRFNACGKFAMISKKASLIKCCMSPALLLSCLLGLCPAGCFERAPLVWNGSTSFESNLSPLAANAFSLPVEVPISLAGLDGEEGKQGPAC